MKKISFILILQLAIFFSFAQSPTKYKYSSNIDELLNIYFSEKTIYGNSVEDYFKKPKEDMVKLSPDGKHLSFVKTDYEGKKNLFVENIETGETTRVVNAGPEIITEYHWANNNYIIYLKTKGDMYNYELFNISISGRHNKHITSFKNEVPRLVDILVERKGYAIIEIKKKGDEFHKPYELNVVTGETKLITINNQDNNAVYRYIFNKTGKLKAYINIVNHVEKQVFYRSSEDKPFEKKLLTNWKTHFNIIDFDYTTSNPNDILVISNMKNDTDEILRYDLEKDEIIETVFTNKDYDISGIRKSISQGHKIYYYYYTSDKKQIIPVSKYFKKLYKKTKTNFKDKNVSLTSVSENDSKYLIYISNDVMYGKYYVYDVAKDEFKNVMNTMPHLDKSEMAKMDSHKFKSRDGLTINYYLTLPQGTIKGSNIPLIVVPHKDPFTSRNTWGYDNEAQLFASRGYATLHVNYRGSEGYGKEFCNAGHKQIGRKIIEDIEDAVYNVLKKGIIDKTRIAIYGTDSAGLTSLQAMMNNPAMFSCAINKSGPCSLISTLENVPETSKAYLPQYYELIYNINDETERQIATDVSPLHNIDKIKKP